MVKALGLDPIWKAYIDSICLPQESFLTYLDDIYDLL